MTRLPILFFLFLPHLVLAKETRDTRSLPVGVNTFLSEMKAERVDWPERPPLFNMYWQSTKKEASPDPQVAVIFLTGMGEFALKYYDLALDLKDLPATLYFWDHIGQGMSYHFLPAERKKVHIDSFETYLGSLENFIQGLRTKYKKIYIIGHSMGGHLALRLTQRHPDWIQGMALSSPMLALNSKKVPIHWIAWLLDYLPGTYFPSLFTLFKKTQNPDQYLTNSIERSRIRREILRVFPEMEREGPTIGWLRESLKSMDALKKADLSAIQTPILMLQAEEDFIVSVEAEKDFCDKVPSCKLVMIPTTRHEILFEKDPARRQAVDMIRAMLPPSS